jgi:DNA repair exonuclease SbcCD ATPase subunit
MRCGQQFTKLNEHDTDACRKKIILSLVEQIQGNRQTIYKLGRKIHGQRQRLGRIESEKNQLTSTIANLQEKADAVEDVTAKFEITRAGLERQLEEALENLDVEQRTRREAIEFARRDEAVAKADNERYTKRILEISRELYDEQKAHNETRSKLAASVDRIDQLTRSNKAINELLASLRKQIAELQSKQPRNFDEVEGFAVGSPAVLYYCGCTYRGSNPPVFCKHHYSPQTKEGLIDGR